ncbi:MAG: response regulator [Alphaproteobacteria bacterium]
MFDLLEGKIAPATNSLLCASVPLNDCEPDCPLDIMLVEDVYADAMLTRIAIEASRIPANISKIARGNEVVSKLRYGRMCYPSRLPDLIILDLGLPGMDGFEILNEMANLPSSLRAIPIVIVTAHKDFDYLRSTYPLYILDYIQKPCDSAHMRRILRFVREERNTVDTLLRL